MKHPRHKFSIFFSMKACRVFSLELPHRSDTKARFPLTTRLTRFNPIAESGTGLIGSGSAVCMSRVVTRKFLTCQKYSCSGRVVKWSGSDRVSIV